MKAGDEVITRCGRRITLTMLPATSQEMQDPWCIECLVKAGKYYPR